MGWPSDTWPAGEHTYTNIIHVCSPGKGLQLLDVNDGRFEINQPLFANDTALVADSEQKLRRLVTELGRVC